MHCTIRRIEPDYLHIEGPTSQGERDAAAARANHSIPPACGIYYYEVTVLDKGLKGYVVCAAFCCPLNSPMRFIQAHQYWVCAIYIQL
jgi:hypothetical protein